MSESWDGEHGDAFWRWVNPDSASDDQPQPETIDADHGAARRDLAAARVAHVLEAVTGYASGSSARALPHEPRTQYDPQTTTTTARLDAKRDELDNDHARAAGLCMSVSTMRRIWSNLRQGKPVVQSRPAGSPRRPGRAPTAPGEVNGGEGS